MDDFRNTHIGMIFQYFNLFEHMSVFENIEFPLNIQKKFCENASHDYSNKLLSYVGLNGLGDVKINELSGGQKQRVAIARAIIKSPQIILADEPTGNLDTQTGSQIMELLKKISNNKLVVVVSHDEELCSRYADMIIRIADGEIKEIGNNCIRNSEEIINRVDDRDFFTQKRRLPKKLSFRNTFRFSLHLMTNKAIRLSFTLIVCVLTLLLMELFIYISDYNSSTVITQYLREYVSNSISSNTRTIGILRSLGVRKRDTLNIFVVEAMFISLLSLVLSMVGLVAFAAYGNIEFSKTLVENPFNIIVINIPHLIVISSLTVLFTLSALSIPIMLLARKTPMQIINNQK